MTAVRLLMLMRDQVIVKGVHTQQQMQAFTSLSSPSHDSSSIICYQSQGQLLIIVLYLALQRNKWGNRV